MKPWFAITCHVLLCLVLLAVLRQPLLLTAGVAASMVVFIALVRSRRAGGYRESQLSEKLAMGRAINSNRNLQIQLGGEDFSERSWPASIAANERVYIVAVSFAAVLLALLLRS